LKRTAGLQEVHLAAGLGGDAGTPELGNDQRLRLYPDTGEILAV
jgi:hypothetical protein